MTMNLDSLLQVTLPIVALIAWFIKRLDKKFDKIDEKFDKIDLRFEKVYDRFESLENKFEQRFNKIDETLKFHGERLAFLEAACLYTMPLEPATSNARSEAAKKRWSAKRLEKQEVIN
jgi:DNA anti-recombination protein RmuC